MIQILLLQNELIIVLTHKQFHLTRCLLEFAQD